MEHVKDMILSSGGEILCTAGECFLTRRVQKESDSYRLCTAIKNSWGGTNISWKPFIDKADYLARAGTEEQRQTLLKELATDGEIIYNREWRSKILEEPQLFPVAECEQYIVVREHIPAETQYSLEAPSHATSCMAAQYPWEKRITATQAKYFELHPDKMLEYYQQCRNQ